MASKPKKCIGTVACLSCGEEIPARVNDNGTLDMGCGYCDFSGYAKAGTEAHRIISDSIKLKEPPDRPSPSQPASAAPVAPAKADATDTPPATPAAKKPLSFVDLLNGGKP